MELVGCSNPGLSYTENTMKNLDELNDWLELHKDSEPMTYREMQESVEKSGGNLDGSAIRMIIPFFRKAGIIKDEEFKEAGKKIDFSRIWTDSGECFMRYVRIYNQLKELEDPKIQRVLDKIFEKFVVIQYSSLIKKSQKVYGEIIEFFHKYKKIDKIEFFMLTTILDRGESVRTSESLREMVTEYRDGKIDADEIKIIRNVNAYGYIMPFLQPYHIVLKNGDSFRLNKKYEHVFDEFLREEEENE